MSNRPTQPLPPSGASGVTTCMRQGGAPAGASARNIAGPATAEWPITRVAGERRSDRLSRRASRGRLWDADVSDRRGASGDDGTSCVLFFCSISFYHFRTKQHIFARLWTSSGAQKERKYKTKHDRAKPGMGEGRKERKQTSRTWNEGGMGDEKSEKPEISFARSSAPESFSVLSTAMRDGRALLRGANSQNDGLAHPGVVRLHTNPRR